VCTTSAAPTGLGPVPVPTEEPVYRADWEKAALQDATELGDARRRVEELVSGMPGEDAPFEQPWELRAFATYDHGSPPSPASHRLIDTQASTSGATSRLTARETVLAGNGALSDVDLDDATKAVPATPRTAGHHEAHREPVAVDPAR